MIEEMKPPVEGPLAIHARDLHMRYGRRRALTGADLRVPEGAAYVLVGPNGAGKTTLMRILLDLVRPDAGAARVLGLDPVSDGAAVRSLCGFLPERHEAGYGWMTVQGLLEHHAAYRPSWDPGYAGELLNRLRVRDHARFGELSKGEARRVQLVMTLAHDPPVLLLDEPTDGLDPVMREEALRLLSDHMGRTDTTLVISTHLVSEVEGIGDHLGVLRDGALRAEMSRETLRARLRRYTVSVPEGWSPGAELARRVVRQEGGGRERALTIWGTEEEVLPRLREARAAVRRVSPLTLEKAAVSLLVPHATDPAKSAPLNRPELEVVSGAGGGR